MAAPDGEVLTRPDVREPLGLSLAETFRQGNGPALWDGVVVARGSGFRLEDIRVPVLIWHGELDRNDPVWMAHEQEARLPNARATYYAGEGHLIFFSRSDEILAALA